MTREIKAYDNELYEPVVTAHHLKEAGQMSLSDWRRELIESGELGSKLLSHTVELEISED